MNGGEHGQPLNPGAACVVARAVRGVDAGGPGRTSPAAAGEAGRGLRQQVADEDQRDHEEAHRPARLLRRPGEAVVGQQHAQPGGGQPDQRRPSTWPSPAGGSAAARSRPARPAAPWTRSCRWSAPTATRPARSRPGRPAPASRTRDAAGGGQVRADRAEQQRPVADSDDRQGDRAESRDSGDDRPADREHGAEQDVIVAPVALVDVVSQYRNSAARPSPAPRTMPVARSRPRGLRIPIMSMTPAASTPVPAKPQQRADPEQERAGAAGHADVGQRVPGVGLAAQHGERADHAGDDRGQAADHQRDVHRRAAEEARREDRPQHPGHARSLVTPDPVAVLHRRVVSSGDARPSAAAGHHQDPVVHA